MELRTLFSGSSGNSTLISHAGVHLMVDAGVSCRRLTLALADCGVDPQSLAGILITHEHSDHIAGLATLTKKYHLPIYTSPGTARQLAYRIAAVEDVLHPVAPGDSFALGPFVVSTFPTPHDAAQSMGFAFEAGGRKAAVVTDLGYVTPEVLTGISGAHLLVCEANHDVDWVLSGPYPYYLKRRILGERGHLSNEAGARLALQCVEQGAHNIVLAHLSAENNTPAHALMTAETIFHAAGAGALRDVILTTAPRNEASPLYEV